MSDKESIRRELTLLLEILALTGEQRDFVESIYQDNANSRGMVMTNKQLRIRYGFHGKHMEKNVAWDGNDQVNSVLAVLIEELSLPIGEKPVNLIEHGVDDVFFYDEESQKWLEIPPKWLNKA
ncbi:hypothetical protein NEN34_23025 [Enterobacter cloacae]|uniref:hypothetical protein n=1 Tax=Enterobacter cloacae TaxID=550 RepID=UPI002A5933AE|nr:hypothetical protein [Enterobacter cloacae]EKU3247590.1 hypothetical protein [Enterobacter hormaechei]MEB7118291.1 hypothetical protein [Enterobacter cloacae]